MRTALVLAFVLVTLVAPPASAQRLVGALGQYQVDVTSGFIGQTLILFGNVETDVTKPNMQVEGPFQVIVVMTGPANNRIVREKTNQFLIWLNTRSATFEEIPSYKWVLSSAPLDEITDEKTLSENRIPLLSAVSEANVQGDSVSRQFGTELVRLMEEMNLYGVNENAVHFLSSTLYASRIELPGYVPNGTFLVETYLFKNKVNVAYQLERLVVRKAGLELIIENSAADHPLLYGLVCVFLALFTGWLGGVVFKR